MTVRVILADDQPLVRAALQMVITDAPDIEVVGEAGTGTEAVELTEGLRPDVVVMDIRMPGMDGIKATRLITAGPSRARVIVLTTFDDDDYVYGALRAGASGFLVKDMALDDILAAIRVVAAGDALIAPSVTRRLIAEFAGHPGPVPESPDGRRHHRAGTRGADPGRARHVQHRDRRPPRHQRGHGQDLRDPGRPGPPTPRSTAIVGIWHACR